MIKKKVLSNRVEYHNDKKEFHREDGPAIEYYGGKRVWYLNGISYGDDEESFQKELIKIKIERLKKL